MATDVIHRSRRPRVAVIGGGAAGTLTAVHVMRAAGPDGVEILLIDRDGEFGPGVAYRTPDPLHLLNVPAVRMGGISGAPEHFHSWLLSRGHAPSPEDFLPRGVFGDYLRDLLFQAEAEFGRGAALRRLSAEVVAIDEWGRPDAPLELRLGNGERLGVDQAVLAIGAPAAGDPVAVPAELRRRGVYISNPWAPGALEDVPRGSSVLILGTGLTMVDVALGLDRPGQGLVVRAVSRNGLLPRRHRVGLTEVRPFPLPLERGKLEPIVAAVLAQVAEAGRRGCDWRDVLDSLRPSTPAIWRSLPTMEKRRFLVSLQRIWDVHRFRMAPAVADRLEAMQRARRLRLDPRLIVDLAPSARGARVTLRGDGLGGAEVEEFDRVVNCTGAGGDVVRHAPRLVTALIAAGRARPDELSIGLDVTPSGALLDAHGHASRRIHAVGYLRKGVEWEAIGITEIRDQAAAVAREALAGGIEQGVAA